ncbi:efflux RND transporter periplasmic adaptor subunit [Alistipes sp.]|uniref:efflux RND transporter periplasmic adaptor subunit n=1 Tax=Alistipes sp. TaxID=1872444 RepID=UPI003AB3D6D6
MKRFFMLPAVVTLTLLAGACASGSKTDNHDHEHEAGEHAEGHAPGEIHFSPEQAEAAGLETETVAPGRFAGVIRTSGQIMPASGDEQTVVASTSGVVTFASGDVAPGMRLAQGQAFASISARQLADGDPVVKAHIAYETAKKEFERAQSLVKEQIISEKNFEQARLNYENAKTAYDAYAGQTGAKGISVSSPIGGHIKQLLVTTGEYVTVGQPIAVVSQNRKLQLRAEVSENQFNRLAGVRSANFRPSYEEKVYSLAELNGRLVSYGRTPEGNSFYLPVVFEFSNTGNFIAGAFAEIWLLENGREGVISVPASALTEEQGVYYVYVKLDEEGYRKQEVRPGTGDGLRTEILSGLKAGDEVVTRGAYQVKLASVSGAIPGHTHNH